MPALISAANATTRIRLGTNVLNNDLRHPVLVAREAATVDILSDGRFMLGLGAGSIRSEYDQIGANFDAGGTRVERLTEAVTIIKGLLAGEKVTFPGRHYRVTGHVLDPLPVQKPRPPILIGGNGRRLLTWPRGRPISSVCQASPSDRAARRRRISPRGGSQNRQRLRLIREIAGDDRYAWLELNVLVQRVIVTDNRCAAAEELAKSRGHSSPRTSFCKAPSC